MGVFGQQGDESTYPECPFHRRQPVKADVHACRLAEVLPMPQIAHRFSPLWRSITHQALSRADSGPVNRNPAVAIEMLAGGANHRAIAGNVGMGAGKRIGY